CENAVSTYMVEKLALKTVGHPEPYQFTWLKKRNAIKKIKIRGRIIIMKGKLMQGVQMGMLRVQGTSKENSRTSFFFREGEDDTDVPDGSSPVDQRAVDENKAGGLSG
nr:reverse transcriptase domain-containing protein [Tanacetum cinerariifolium]